MNKPKCWIICQKFLFCVVLLHFFVASSEVMIMENVYRGAVVLVHVACLMAFGVLCCADIFLFHFS